jgi:hypothetical protein
MLIYHNPYIHILVAKYYHRELWYLSNCHFHGPFRPVSWGLECCQWTKSRWIDGLVDGTDGLLGVVWSSGYLGLSTNGGSPIAGWFIMENPSIYRWYRDTPISGHLHLRFCELENRVFYKIMEKDVFFLIGTSSINHL